MADTKIPYSLLCCIYNIFMFHILQEKNTILQGSQTAVKQNQQNTKAQFVSVPQKARTCQEMQKEPFLIL